MNNVIISKDNPDIKLFKKLSNQRKYRDLMGKFTLEGKRIVLDALTENAVIDKIFITESVYDKKMSFANCELTVISDELGRKISLTENSQGVFAICRKPNVVPLDSVMRTGGKFIILHKLQDPGNLGMIVRTADAVGIHGIIACESCDIFSPKVVRATMGSIFRMNFWDSESISDTLDAMRKNGVQTFASVVDKNAADIKRAKFNADCAVLIGNEGNGLESDVVSMCDNSVTIKMSGNINSLNAAMAAGIIMWEMVR